MKVKIAGVMAATAAFVAAWVVALGGGACAYPTCFPDASNTGVAAGTTLTAYTGSTNISTNNVTIDSKTVTGCLVISGDNVTIRNSVVNCDSGIGISFLDNQAINGLVEDTEVDCTGAAGGSGINEGNFTARRVEIRSCENGFDLNQNVLIEDSYVHDLEAGGADPHEDGIQFGCGHYTGNPGDTAACGGSNIVNYDDGAANITIRHNWIRGIKDTGTNATSSIIMNKQGTGPDTNILVENNLLDGGGSTVYCTRTDDTGSIQTGVNVRVINNHFTTFGGTTTECADEADTSGNVVHETGLPYVLD